MFLLDTCVVSEGPKPRRDENVVRWLSEQDSSALYISAITAGELRHGVNRLPPGRGSKPLYDWLQAMLQRGFAGRILPFDDVVAELWGNLRAGFPNAEIADSQIAATAIVHKLTLVTRNIGDFPFPALRLFNPWSK